MANHNDFPEDTRVLFIYNWRCWRCSKNRADCLHHIVGRGTGDSDCERSALNAAPLCNHSCHLPYHGSLRTEENVRIFLNRTYEFLVKAGYKFREVDLEFLEKYSRSY